MNIELSKNKDYSSWIHKIKKRVYRLQIKAALSVNSEMLAFYWDLGKDIIEKQEKCLLLHNTTKIVELYINSNARKYIF